MQKEEEPLILAADSVLDDVNGINVDSKDHQSDEVKSTETVSAEMTTLHRERERE